MSIKQIDEICQSINEQLLNGEIFRIVCIDDTTDNQFYEKQSKNKLNNKGTVFFTSGSMEQLGAEWDSLFTFFSDSNINYIFHVEPILELYSDSRLESLSSSFHQKKNYLTGYFSFLETQSKFDVSYSKTDFGTLYDQGFNVVILQR